MAYRLLTTDLDDTLLNAKKAISKENIEAIRRALHEDKTVLFATGRCLDEVRELMAYFPAMRYVICESGANIYDCKENHLIFSKLLDRTLAETILEYASKRDIMIQVMIDGSSVMAEKHVNRLEHYHASQYNEHFHKVCVIVPDAYEYCKSSNWKIAKFCLYHPTPEERDITKAQLAHLPVIMSNSEETMVELSPSGIDKGVGLEELCRHLDVSLTQTIAIGDGYNDLPILKKAGLSIAVANAREEVKEACDVIVADNEHHGVKEAIEKYLFDE